MKWTTKLPNKTGWYWHRHICGGVNDDQPLHAIIMRHPVKVKRTWKYKYDPRPSVYWRGKWTDVKKLPTGYNFRWSDRPICLPRGEASNAADQRPAAKT